MKIGVTSEPLFKLIAAMLVVSLVFSMGCLGTGSAAGNSFAAQNQSKSVGDAMANQGSQTGTATSGNPIVTFVTTKGTFKAEIYRDKAPISATNFLKLVKSGFYTNITFHRYVAGFVIQGGDPKGDGSGGSPDTISLEIVKGLTHVKGSLGMARTMDPNSASSQFYVSLADIHSLDGQYAVFGQVLEGMDVVLKLRQGDRMLNVAVG